MGEVRAGHRHEVYTNLFIRTVRFGPKHRIDPAEDFTRLTLDTIALCSMSYRWVYGSGFESNFHTDAINH